MTAKEKYIKDNRLGRLSKKQKELIFAYEPWLSLDNCATSAVFQVSGKYEDDIFSDLMEYARLNTHVIYIEKNEAGPVKHIGTVVDLRGWDDVE